MLAYSGRGRFVVQPVDLSALVSEMASLLRTSVPRNVAFDMHLEPSLPCVQGDPAQLQQIVLNLITNAAEAIGARDGAITLRTSVRDVAAEEIERSRIQERPAPGLYVCLEVADDGCGMDDATQQRLFEPFFTTKETGRGLGMAAVLGIVRGHRGAIKVYSEVGRGTTFKILLPAVEWDSGEKVETGEQRECLEGGGVILVIDDDPFVRNVASAMLTTLGFQVLTADNGLEGLDAFRAHQAEIDCVLLDLMMPEMGGEETFRELRRLKHDLPVIMSSGYNEQDVTQRFVGRGLTGFLQKPYTVANLRAALKKALG
ncbi:MAG: Blue-light-activated protein [Syntrophus sp. PtaU1.Bin208]|nr:MAG: Blue-light-activated protein [Syntrophus sp. PtaU1.Bin208]